MFGGTLLSSTIYSFKSQNAILAVYSNELYIFDAEESQILKKLSLSDTLIKAWAFIQQNHKLVALDQAGLLIQVTFNGNKKNGENWYDNANITNKKIVKGQINQAKIIIADALSSSFVVYFILQDTLYAYEDGAKNPLLKQCIKIVSASQNHIICSETNDESTIKILLLQKSKHFKQLSYTHSSEITSCAVYEQSLIIGDEKGKIFILRNYLSSEKNKNVVTKYEWHVHQVNSLFIEQEYLYSCGEEGTVVMWHLRENKRDFLPRIGTQIMNVCVSEGVVYCMLKDNSITSIDLTNDKSLKHFKTIINPFGFTTKSIQEHSTHGKQISLVSSQSNKRNLLAISALPGSLQVLDFNNGDNKQIEVLPRNLISRIDQYYPEPHEIHDVSFNKEWTLMCCSSYGVNHNYLHFFKNQGYNLDFTLISKVENPHEGAIKILNYNNNFITYAENQSTLRFWSRVRRAKKSIIQKEEEYFICSGEINYRQKLIKNCAILQQEQLLLVNFQDEIILIDLKKRTIEMAFKGPSVIQKAWLLQMQKHNVHLILVTTNKILAYQVNRDEKTLTNKKDIYNFESLVEHQTHCTISHLNGLAGFLINYESHQVIFEYNFSKNIISNSFSNDDLQKVAVLALTYQNNKLIAFGSDSALTNLTNSEDVVKLATKKTQSINAMQTEDETVQHFELQSFENLHKNYVIKQNVRKRGEINEVIQKIELQMYPSLGFSFTALAQKLMI